MNIRWLEAFMENKEEEIKIRKYALKETRQELAEACEEFLEEYAETGELDVSGAEPILEQIRSLESEIDALEEELAAAGEQYEPRD